MKAMVLKEICEIKINGKNQQINNLPLKEEPLELIDMPIPEPAPNEILIKILACGVCHTELDQIEGRITPPKFPIILGHQPVGIVTKIGKEVSKFKIGDKAGATWIYSSCGKCKFCKSERENLCDQFKATGCHANGGYAEYMVISEDYAHKIPESFIDLNYVAPLMCSGIVGYRSLKLTGMQNGKTLGLYGFGSAHHLVIQVAKFLFPDSKIFVITRNFYERELAKKLGADWTGDIEDKTPQKLDCAIDTTPVWKPVIFALENLEKGGRLVINLIRKEESDKDYLLKLNYPKHLWMEKEIKTVANVTIKDGKEFLSIAAKMQIKPQIQLYNLEQANKALIDLKSAVGTGSKVLKISDI